jgi:two-component system OmpR family response regulator
LIDLPQAGHGKQWRFPVAKSSGMPYMLPPPISDKFAQKSPDQGKSRQLKCVLCVDDEVDFQSIIRISLERLGGIKSHFCTDPQQAMARAREVKPDLILLDFVMPELDGATLFKRLQADPDLAAIPVVFLTAVMTGPDARALNMLGAAGVLVKPFDVLELPRKLSEIWNNR